LIGTFQQTVLISVAVLGGRGDAASVIAEVERRLDRAVPRGAVHVTLQRLERKRMICSKAAAERRRVYRIEAAGLRALAAAKEEAEKTWQGVSLEAK
jgi:DNA-binding PadR family transcriptional regulator